MKARTSLLVALLFLASLAQAGTVGGTLALPNTALPLANASLTFTLSQTAYQAGLFAVVPSSVPCWTSVNGSITGLPNPLLPPVATPDTISGVLAPGTYFVQLTYTNALGNESLASPEATVVLSGGGKITVTAPALSPATASGWNLYVGQTSGSETFQTTAALGANIVFGLSSGLQAGANPPGANNAACTLAFTDTLIPSGTFYNTTVVDANGATVPGFPQRWQLWGGANGIVNVSFGFPLASAITVFPTPIQSNPPSSVAQSINSALSITGNLSVTGSANFSGPLTAGGNISAGTNSVIGTAFKNSQGGVVAHQFQGTCSGTATAGQASLGLFGIGQNSALTCTQVASDTTGSAVVASAGTLQNFRVLCGTGGVNGSSGVFTVFKNGGASGIACTTGTATTCSDLTHTVNVVGGDHLAIAFSSQGGETLASCRASLEKQ